MILHYLDLADGTEVFLQMVSFGGLKDGLVRRTQPFTARLPVLPVCHLYHAVIPAAAPGWESPVHRCPEPFFSGWSDSRKQ